MLQYLCEQRTYELEKPDRPPLVYKTGVVNWGGQDWTVHMDWRREWEGRGEEEKGRGERERTKSPVRHTKEVSI